MVAGRSRAGPRLEACCGGRMSPGYESGPRPLQRRAAPLITPDRANRRSMPTRPRARCDAAATRMPGGGGLAAIRVRRCWAPGDVRQPWQFAGRAPRSDRRGVDDEYEAACAVSGSQWGRADVDGCAAPAIRVGQARRSGNVEGGVGRCPGPAVRFGSDGRGARARGGAPPPDRRPPAPLDRRRRARSTTRSTDGIAKRMELRPATRRALGQADRAAHLALHGSYFHVRVATEADHEPSESPHWLDLVAADNVVLTQPCRAGRRSSAISTTASRPTPTSARSTRRPSSRRRSIRRSRATSSPSTRSRTRSSAWTGGP